MYELLKEDTNFNILNKRLQNMRSRCYNKNDKNYASYGKLGVKICDEWKDSKTGIISFYFWSVCHGFRKDLTIDRIDPYGNYEPDNCRWADKYLQTINKRNSVLIEKDNKIMSIYDYCKGNKRIAIRIKRRIINNNWTLYAAENIPPRVPTAIAKKSYKESFYKEYDSVKLIVNKDTRKEKDNIIAEKEIVRQDKEYIEWENPPILLNMVRGGYNI